MRQIIELSGTGDSFQKGVQWEAAAEYFISHTKGLKVSGRRIHVGLQEIDLSVVNTSLDSNLWEMGAYFLTECKNWTDKVGIPVIRALSYSSNMKGNKTTLLWGNERREERDSESGGESAVYPVLYETGIAGSEKRGGML